MSKQVDVGYEELAKMVNNYKMTRLKSIRYGFFVQPFMPTGPATVSDEPGEMGFEGCAMVMCTKKEFLRVAKTLLINLEKRGAKLRVNVPTGDFEAWVV